MIFTAGTKLGPYEILFAIGAGGQGEVYKARDTRLNRTVAIKLGTSLGAIFSQCPGSARWRSLRAGQMRLLRSERASCSVGHADLGAIWCSERSTSVILHFNASVPA